MKQTLEIFPLYLTFFFSVERTHDGSIDCWEKSWLRVKERTRPISFSFNSVLDLPLGFPFFLTSVSDPGTYETQCKSFFLES